MTGLNVQRIDQNYPSPLITIKGEKICYRYAFDRSADSIRTNQPGQDYLVIVSDTDHLAFVLCDGVSQSFYGDVSAKILGEKFVNWLWENGKDFGQEKSQLINKVSLFLNHLTEEASVKIEDMDLPEALPSMLRVVLEKKRKMGSESTFTSGFIDFENKRLFLCWMGDSRLRIWDRCSEKTSDLLGAETFQTRERWSSCKGLVGELHVGIFSTNDIIHLVTYSDGLSRLDHSFSRGSPSDRTLSGIFEESKLLSASDDISFLEIWIGKCPTSKPVLPSTPKKVTVNNLFEQEKLKISWQPVKNVNQYEVALLSSNGWQIISSDQPHLEKHYNEINGIAGKCMVRSWKNEEASDWSREIEYRIPNPKQEKTQNEFSEPYYESSEQIPVENFKQNNKKFFSLFNQRQFNLLTRGKIAMTLLIIIAMAFILLIHHDFNHFEPPTTTAFFATKLIPSPSSEKIHEIEVLLTTPVLDTATIKSPIEITNKKRETPSPPFYNHFINGENKFDFLILQ